MRKLIVMFLFVLLVLSCIVLATSVTLPTVIKNYNRTDETGVTGLWNGTHNYTKIYDDNLSTYGAGQTAVLLLNFTKMNDSDSSTTKFRTRYNTSTGVTTINYTLSDYPKCWSYLNDKLMFKLTSNETNKSAQTGARYCYNGSTWVQLGSTESRAQIYEAEMLWGIESRTLEFTYTSRSPSSYTTDTSGTINFTFIATDTSADLNHTTFNCSIWTRNSTDLNFSTEISDTLITNGTAASTMESSFNDGERVQWYTHCEDEYDREILNDTVSWIDIDTDYQTLSLGILKLISFELTTGIMTASGLVTDIFRIMPNTTSYVCDATTAGRIYYQNNTALGIGHYACNGTAWYKMY